MNQLSLTSLILLGPHVGTHDVTYARKHEVWTWIKNAKLAHDYLNYYDLTNLHFSINHYSYQIYLDFIQLIFLSHGVWDEQYQAAIVELSKLETFGEDIS